MCINLLVNTCWDLSVTIKLFYILMISCHLYICNVSMLCWCSSVHIFKVLFVSCELILAFPSYPFLLRGSAIWNEQYRLDYIIISVSVVLMGED